MAKTSINDTSFEINPIGFENRIDYAAMYHLHMGKLNEIHTNGSIRDAISYFNAEIVPSFGGMFDKQFIINCKEICDNEKVQIKAYMLHRVEFGRLMTRAGIAAKPDIRIRYKANWEVPTEIKNMSQDGTKKAKGDD